MSSCILLASSFLSQSHNIAVWRCDERNAHIRECPSLSVTLHQFSVVVLLFIDKGHTTTVLTPPVRTVITACTLSALHHHNTTTSLPSLKWPFSLTSLLPLVTKLDIRHSIPTQCNPPRRDEQYSSYECCLISPPLDDNQFFLVSEANSEY